MADKLSAALLTQIMQILLKNLFNSMRLLKYLFPFMDKNIHKTICSRYIKVSKNKFFHNICIILIAFWVKKKYLLKNTMGVS